MTGIPALAGTANGLNSAEQTGTIRCMKMIFTALGTNGDLLPLLAVAEQALARGHEAIVITTQEHRKRTESIGATFIPIFRSGWGGHFSEYPEAEDPIKMIELVDRYYVREAIPEFLTKIRALKTEDTVVIVGTAANFAVRLICEYLRIPQVTLFFAPISVPSAEAPPKFGKIDHLNYFPKFMRSIFMNIGYKYIVGPRICQTINDFRYEHGMPLIKPIDILKWFNTAECLVAMYPSWFQCALHPKLGEEVPSDIDQRIQFLGFPLFETNLQSYQPSHELESFLARYPNAIAFTFGTGTRYCRQYFEMALEVCVAMKQPAVFLSQYRGNCPPNLPEYIRYEGYVPFEWLLARVKAIAYHGGIGTLSQAMAAGAVQLVFPSNGDQWDNAARVKKLGLGEWIPLHQLTNKRLTRLLKKLNKNSIRYEENCSAFAKRIQQPASRFDAAHLVEQIEQLMPVSQTQQLKKEPLADLVSL